MAEKERIGEITFSNQTITLDKLNNKILSILLTNAKIPFSEIAKKVNLSKSNVARRIAQLEEKRLITGYHAHPILNKLNINAAMILIKITLNQEEKGMWLKEIENIGEIYSIFELTGKYNLGLTFYYSSEKQKDELAEKIISSKNISAFNIFRIKTLFSTLNYTDIPQTTQPKEILQKEAQKKKRERQITKEDIQIAYLLSRNCREKHLKISEKLKIPRETVNYKIKKLISERIIDKFQPTINLFMLGYEAYFLKIKLSKPTQKKGIITFLDQTRRCNTILQTEGYYDLITFIHFKSNKEFISFENNLLNQFKESIHEYDFELVKNQLKLDWFPEKIKEYLIKNITH